MQRSIAGMLALAVGVSVLAAAAWQGDGEPCCNIAAIDAASGVATVKDKSKRFSFAATLADAKQVTALRVGRAVGLNNADKQLLLPNGGGRPPAVIALSDLRFIGFTPPSAPGVAGSAVTSSGGTFTREPNNKRCPWLKETPTTQCVLTHQTQSTCEYFCVTINR